MAELKKYKFIGNEKLLKLVKPELEGTIISSVSDIFNWIKSNIDKKQSFLEITATFVIDPDLQLRINHQRSEHVVCAGGKEVLSAGEITFLMDKNNRIKITAITNQSTGYCPSPNSWKIVKSVLENIGIEHPENFTTSYIFRICTKCNLINIVKDNYYFCVNCETEFDKNET